MSDLNIQLPKHWSQSKTVWSGILKIVAGAMLAAGAYLAGEMDVQTLVSGVGSAAWGVFDIILRFKTNKPIS